MQRSLEQLLVEKCAPTLAGIKPANLFRCEDSPELFRSVCEWNKKLYGSGIRIRVVKRCRKTHACLVYVCRWERLSNVLTQKDIQTFLKLAGYDISKNMEGILCELSHRLCVRQDFPHEIGVFLGYPLRDVIGFIENKGKNYSCCGHWKCYGNAEEAKERFAMFDSCTEYYKKLYYHGVPLMKIIVT